MTVKLKYGQIESSAIFINSIMEKEKKEDSKVELSNSFSLKLFRIHKALMKQMEEFGEIVKDVQEKHIKRDENGDKIIEKEENSENEVYKIENMEEYKKDINDLYMTECEFSIPNQLTVEELDKQNLDLDSFGDLAFLDHFIEE